MRAERAKEMHGALSKVADEQERDGRRLVLSAPPGLVYDANGEPSGVDAWVRLFEGGRELPVDPHRIFINPPTGVVVDDRDGFDIATGKFVKPQSRQDPKAAFWNILWDSVTGTPNPRGWRTRGTVTTVYAGTTDGYISSTTVSDDYPGARSGTSLSADTTATTMRVGQLYINAKFDTYTCYEAFLSFDTSSIADTDNVDAVALDMWLTTDTSVTDFIVQARERDWGAGLTTADWVAGASLGGLTQMATLNSSGIGATGAYKTFTSDTAFLSATGLKTGTVYLLLCSKEQTDNSAPTTDEYLTFSSADNTGTTQDPKLTITHSAPTKAILPAASRPQRIWRTFR